MNILITGATDHVALSVLNHLTNQNNNLKVVAGVRNVEKEKVKIQELNVSLLTFDFKNIQTFQPAFQGIDKLFLLPPPQMADVEKCFKPLVEEVKECSV